MDSVHSFVEESFEKKYNLMWLYRINKIKAIERYSTLCEIISGAVHGGIIGIVILIIRWFREQENERV